MEAQRIREGVKLMVEGDKAASKGVFKKPDWDIAGSHYENAGMAFKVGKSYDQAVQAYAKASEALFKANAIYMSAKAMETAAQIVAQNMKQPERAAEAYRRASELYVTHGSADRGAEMLEKAAKTIETTDVNEAIELYTSACSMYESEDRGKFAVDTFKRAISLMVKNKKYSKAIDMLQRLGTVQATMTNRGALYKNNLSIIILILETGDEVEAGKQYQTFLQRDGGFPQSEESSICQGLLEAFEHGDQDLLDRTVKRQNITFLENDITRLARQLKVPGESLSGGGFGAVPASALPLGVGYNQSYSIPTPLPPSRTPYPPRQPTGGVPPAQAVGYQTSSRPGGSPSLQQREYDRPGQQATDRSLVQPTSPTQQPRGYEYDRQQQQQQQQQPRYDDRGRAPHQEYGRPPPSPGRDYDQAPAAQQPRDYDYERQQNAYPQQQRPPVVGEYQSYQPQLRERSPGPGLEPTPIVQPRDKSPIRGPGPRGPAPSARDPRPQPQVQQQSLDEPLRGGPGGMASAGGHAPQQQGRRPEDDYERGKVPYQQTRERSPAPPASRQQAPPQREYVPREPTHAAPAPRVTHEEEEYKFERLADRVAPDASKPPASTFDDEGDGYDDYLNDHFDALGVNDEHEQQPHARQAPQAPQAPQLYRPQLHSPRDQQQRGRRYEEEEDDLR